MIGKIVVCAVASLLLAEVSLAADWEGVDSEPEAVIVTRNADGSPRETTIWFVFVGSELYVRAVRASRWGRNAERRPEVFFRAGDTETRALATRVVDANTLASVRQAVEEKYPDSNWWAGVMRAMLGGIKVFHLTPGTSRHDAAPRVPR